MSAIVLRTTDGVIEVLSGDLSMPVRGDWTAHLEVGEDQAPAGAVTIEVGRDDGGAPVTFAGTVRRGGPWGGRTKLVVVGGLGGLLTPLAPRSYRGGAADVAAKDIAADLATATGEALDASVAAALEGLGLPRWVRAAIPGTTAFGLFADELGMGWRVLDTGAVWIGPETWPAIADDAITYELEDDTDELFIECAPDAPTLRPGVTVLERRVTRVLYQLSGSRLSCKLFYAQAERDDFRAALETVLPPAVYREIHGATVKAQGADGTLDLEADDARLGELNGIPFRAGLVGSKQTIGAGERVRVRFEDGSPAAPYASDLDQDSTAATAVARVGDSVDAGTLTGATAPGGGPVTFTWQPPTPPGGPTPPPIVSASIPLAALIASGSREVSIR